MNEKLALKFLVMTLLTIGCFSQDYLNDVYDDNEEDVGGSRLVSSSEAMENLNKAIRRGMDVVGDFIKGIFPSQDQTNYWSDSENYAENYSDDNDSEELQENVNHQEQHILGVIGSRVSSAKNQLVSEGDGLKDLLIDEKWTHQFDKTKTKKKKFTLLSGETITVMMMRNEKKVKHAKGIASNNQRFEAVALPVQNRNYLVVFVVPNDYNTFVNTFRNDVYYSIINKLQEKTVDYQIPRLDMTMPFPPYRSANLVVNENRITINGNLRNTQSAHRANEGLAEDEDFISNKPFLIFIHSFSDAYFKYWFKIVEPEPNF